MNFSKLKFFSRLNKSKKLTFKYLSNISFVFTLALILVIFVPRFEANAQSLLHDKRLKTNKQGEKTTRKKLFIKRDGESSKKTKTDIRTTEPGGAKKDTRTGVRTTEPGGRKKDDRDLNSPSYEEGSHQMDQGERDFNRPISPETSFSGRKKSKKKEKNPNKDFSNYGGNLKSSSNVVKPHRVVPQSNKGVKGKSQNQLKKEFERISAGNHQYSGNIKVRNSKNEGNPNKKSSFYTGNLKSSSNIIKPQRGVAMSNKGSKGKSEKKIEKGFESKSKEMHQYAGKVKVPSLSSKTKYFKKFSKNAHQYGGDIRIKKSKYKDLHPSVSYLEGKKKNSYEKKEKLRKRKISWFKFWKNSDQPKSVKEKPVRPKYDSRENEIWYE